MNSRAKFYLSAVVILGALLTIGVTAAWSAVPDSINYQGILKTAGGSPVTNGNHNVIFKIYDVAFGPNPALWSETKSVTTVDGLFTTLLGSVTPLPPMLFSGPNRFLGITVTGSGDPEMTPRVVLVTVPYAFRVYTVDGSRGGIISGNVEVTGGHISLETSTETTGNIKKGDSLFIHNYGDSNTFIGNCAGNLTMTGSRNTASGSHALYNNSTGLRNTASGANALYSNTTGRINTASGYNALYSNTYGSYNTASGCQALTSNSDGDLNTASGFDALKYNTTGFENTASGEFALVGNTTGNFNTASGGNALLSNTTGSKNTAIGYNADVSAGDLTNAAAVGANAIVNASNTFLFGNSSVRRWGFGVNAAVDHAIEVGTDTANGNGAYLTSGGTWTNTSDRNVKEGIALVDRSELLQKVTQLPVYRWNYKGEDPSHQHVGPMAQDFHAVFGLGDDDKHISTIDPSGVALAAIQALNEKLNEQKAENDDLRAQIAELREMIRLQANNGK